MTQARHRGVTQPQPDVEELVPDGQNGRLALRILGPLAVHDPSGREIRSVVAQPKRLALLCYLALTARDQYRQRDTVVALFWPEFDQARARGALRQALSWLRHELGNSVLTTRGEEEIGVATSGVWCDAVAFDEAIAARDHERALELYRGHLLEGVSVTGAAAEFEHWLDAEQARRHQQATRAAIALAEREGAAGRMAAAVDWAGRAAFLAPNDEDVHRRRLRLIAASGDRAGALAVHAAFAERLDAEFGTPPSAETARVVAEVQASRDVAAEGATPMPLRSIRDSIPEGIDEAVAKALAREPEDRYASAGEFAAALDAGAQASPSNAGVPPRTRSWRWPALVAVVAVVATTVGALSRRSPAAPAPPTRQQFTYSGDAYAPALSPDGRMIAFVQGEPCPDHGRSCSQVLLVRDLAAGPPVVLARGTQIREPKWHPDGGSVLFQANRVLDASDTMPRGAYRVSRLGGSPRRIGPGGAAAFSRTGDTVVVATRTGVMNDTVKVSFLRSSDVAVFDSVSVTFTNGGLNDLDWSPDGKWLALLVYRGQGDRRVVLVSRRRGIVTDSMRVSGLDHVRWVPAGDAVLVLLQGSSSDDRIFRIGVDRRTGRFTSDTITKLSIPAGGSTFDLSRDGTILAYVDEARTMTEYIAITRNGERATARSLLEFTGSRSSAVLSPDGRTVVLSRSDAQGRNLYRIPFEGGAERAITSARDHFATPVWLRDGRLVFKRGLPSDRLLVGGLTSGQSRPFGPEGYTTGNPFYLQSLDDSSYVLDQRDLHRVLVLDSRGTIRDTVMVPDTLDQLFAVTPDARQLWFFDRDFATGRFYSLDRETKQVKVAFNTPPNARVLGWADNVYAFATWPRLAASRPSLWHVNPGGRHTRVAELPADCDFGGLSMSRDGRRFVCSRTDAKRDIWLLRGVDLWRR